MIKICGRYYLKISIDKLLEKYGIINDDIDLDQFDEIFPTQKAPVILNDKEHDEERRVKLYKWGFSPSYLKRPIINARAESLDRKKTFKGPFEKKRCIIPVSGFFEWKKENDKKIKCRIYLKDQELFALAGLYDSFYDDKTGDNIPSYTIITTDADSKVEKIHNRMPAILTGNSVDDWLDPEMDSHQLKNLLKPYGQDDLIIEAENDQLSLNF